MCERGESEARAGHKVNEYYSHMCSAYVGMFEHVQVKAYGKATPLGEVAQVTIKSPTLAVINVYDGEVSATTGRGGHDRGTGSGAPDVRPLVVSGAVLQLVDAVNTALKEAKLDLMPRVEGNALTGKQAQAVAGAQTRVACPSGPAHLRACHGACCWCSAAAQAECGDARVAGEAGAAARREGQAEHPVRSRSRKSLPPNRNIRGGKGW